METPHVPDYLPPEVGAEKPKPPKFDPTPYCTDPQGVAFLVVLAQIGNVSRASADIGESRAWSYNRCQHDKDFAAGMKRAQALGGTRLHGKAHEVVVNALTDSNPNVRLHAAFRILDQFDPDTGEWARPRANVKREEARQIEFELPPGDEDRLTAVLLRYRERVGV